MALATQFCPATANIVMLSNIAGSTPQKLMRQNMPYVGFVAVAVVACLLALPFLQAPR